MSILRLLFISTVLMAFALLLNEIPATAQNPGGDHFSGGAIQLIKR